MDQGKLFESSPYIMKSIWGMKEASINLISTATFESDLAEK